MNALFLQLPSEIIEDILADQERTSSVSLRLTNKKFASDRNLRLLMEKMKSVMIHLINDVSELRYEEVFVFNGSYIMREGKIVPLNRWSHTNVEYLICDNDLDLSRVSVGRDLHLSNYCCQSIFGECTYIATNGNIYKVSKQRKMSLHCVCTIDINYAWRFNNYMEIFDDAIFILFEGILFRVEGGFTSCVLNMPVRLQHMAKFGDSSLLLICEHLLVDKISIYIYDVKAHHLFDVQIFGTCKTYLVDYAGFIQEFPDAHIESDFRLEAMTSTTFVLVGNHKCPECFFRIATHVCDVTGRTSFFTTLRAADPMLNNDVFRHYYAITCKDEQVELHYFSRHYQDGLTAEKITVI
jgi:hypothetical protein